MRWPILPAPRSPFIPAPYGSHSIFLPPTATITPLSPVEARLAIIGVLNSAELWRAPLPVFSQSNAPKPSPPNIQSHCPAPLLLSLLINTIRTKAVDPQTLIHVAPSELQSASYLPLALKMDVNGTLPYFRTPNMASKRHSRHMKVLRLWCSSFTTVTFRIHEDPFLTLSHSSLHGRCVHLPTTFAGSFLLAVYHCEGANPRTCD